MYPRGRADKSDFFQVSQKVVMPVDLTEAMTANIFVTNLVDLERLCSEYALVRSLSWKDTWRGHWHDRSYGLVTQLHISTPSGIWAQSPGD